MNSPAWISTSTTRKCTVLTMTKKTTDALLPVHADASCLMPEQALLPRACGRSCPAYRWQGTECWSTSSRQMNPPEGLAHLMWLCNVLAWQFKADVALRGSTWTWTSSYLQRWWYQNTLHQLGKNLLQNRVFRAYCSVEKYEAFGETPHISGVKNEIILARNKIEIFHFFEIKFGW